MNFEEDGFWEEDWGPEDGGFGGGNLKYPTIEQFNPCRLSLKKLFRWLGWGHGYGDRRRWLRLWWQLPGWLWPAHDERRLWWHEGRHGKRIWFCCQPHDDEGRFQPWDGQVR